jgi:glycosyltransferase involved in cell wall biosynthesis
MTAGKHLRPFGRLRGMFLRRWYSANNHVTMFSSSGSKYEFSDYYSKAKWTCIIQSGVQLKKPLDMQISNQFHLDPFFKKKQNYFSDLPIIGVACQFVPQKNLHSLIECWFQLKRDGIHTRLLLIGDGPDRSGLEERLERADASSWCITGWSANYAKYMEKLDVFVMPSHFESLPLTLLEVVGMGVPAVISNFHGAQEVAEKAHWVDVLKDQKPSTIANAVSERLNNKQKISSEDCEKFINYFSPKRMAQDLLKRFNSI